MAVYALFQNAVNVDNFRHDVGPLMAERHEW